MATAARNDADSDYVESDSLTQESDEIQEMFCEHCEKELKTKVKADGFCLECLDYLCSTCLRYHRKYKSDHTLQDNATMPQTFCFQKCQYHSTELIKFYCKSCEQKACIVCKTNEHLQCTIEHLQSLVGSTDLKGKVSAMVKTIDNNLAIITDSRDEISSKRLEVQAVSQYVLSSIKNHKLKLQNRIEDLYKNRICELSKKHGSEMESYEKWRADVLAKLDKKKEVLINNQQLESKLLGDDKILSIEQTERREKDLSKQCTKIKQQDETIMDTRSNKSDKIGAELETMKQSICKKMQRNQNCEAFLALKEAEYKIEKLNTDMEEVSEIGEIKYYDFQSSDEKISELNSPISYGSLEEKSRIKRNISLLHDLGTNNNTDQKESVITGLCKVSDKHLIAADNSNASIKTIDIERKVVSGVIKLEGRPFEITLLENNTIATTLPNTKKIQLLSVTQDNQLSFHSQITVQGECYGIAFKKPNLIVGCPGKVLVISSNGTILNTFAEVNGTPLHIILHPNGNDFYVTGNRSNGCCILKITMPGKVIVKQTLTNFYLPLSGSIAIDKAGTIYHCSQDCKTLTQLSADFQTKHIHKIERMEYQRFMSFLFKMSCKGALYCNKENKIYVVTDKGFIRVYTVT